MVFVGMTCSYSSLFSSLSVVLVAYSFDRIHTWKTAGSTTSLAHQMPVGEWQELGLEKTQKVQGLCPAQKCEL